MSTPTRWVAPMALVLSMLTGCGEGEAEADPEPASSQSESEDAAPVGPEISNRTACQLLFPNSPNKTALMRRATEWVAGDEPISGDRADQIQEDVDEIQDVASRTPDPLKGHLVAWAEIVQGLLEDNSGAEWDTTDFKASGLEITNTCLDTM